MQANLSPAPVISDPDQVLTLLSKLPSLLPRRWLLSHEWLDIVCTLATISDDAFVWNCVFKLLRQASLKPCMWKTFFPLLEEIQRPVPGTIVRETLVLLKKHMPVMLTPVKRALRNLVQSPDVNANEVFWPQFIILVKELTHRRNRITKARILRLFLKHRSLIPWSTYRDSWKRSGSLYLARCGLKPNEYVWGDRNEREIEYVDKLVRCQANELTWIRHLSRSVSEKLRCVVLTMHNASLGASSGWGIPDFREQFCDPITYEEFEKDVQDEKYAFLKTLEDSSEIRTLKNVWVSRLVEPKLGSLLYYLVLSAKIGTFPENALREWQARLRPYLNFEKIKCHLEDTLGLIPIHPAVIELFLTNTMKWAKRILDGWLEWHALLLAILSSGHRYVADGKCQSLVVPWINKFFISSKRKQDIDYLELLIRFILGFVPDTKILFVDDTTKKSDPSLKLALHELNNRLHPISVQGMGVFGNDVHHQKNADFLEKLIRLFKTIPVIIVRPCPSVPRYTSFYELLRKRNTAFLTAENYDSSWKDNLDFLYWGTSVFPLTDAINFDPHFSPVIATRTGPVPFGVYYKTSLLKHSLGLEISRAAPSSLFAEYGYIANILD